MPLKLTTDPNDTNVNQLLTQNSDNTNIGELRIGGQSVTTNGTLITLTTAGNINFYTKDFKPTTNLVSYGSFGYVSSSASSSWDSTTQPVNAFDNNAATYWHSIGNAYNLASGNYLLSASTTVDGVAYAGEWLQLRLNTSIVAYSYNLRPRSGFANSQMPGEWILAGSNDGIMWSLIDRRTRSSWTDNYTQNIVIGTNNTSYSYYRLIFLKSVTTTSGTTVISIAEWQLVTGIQKPVLSISSSTGNIGIGMDNPNNIFQVGSGGRLRISNSTEDYTVIGTNDIDNSANVRIVISGNDRPYAEGGTIEYIAKPQSRHIFYGGTPDVYGIINSANGFVNNFTGQHRCVIKNLTFNQ